MTHLWQPDQSLAPQAEADLETVASAIERRVRADVAAAAPGEPLWAVCLESGFDEEPVLIPAAVHLCSRPDRDRVLASGRSLYELWSYPDGWSTGAFEVEDLHAQELEGRLYAALVAAGSQEPNRYVLNVAARRLSRGDWSGVETTDDFLSYVASLGGAADVVPNVEFSATPEALTVLRERGLLFEDV
jgi:hypothetical protein